MLSYCRAGATRSRRHRRERDPLASRRRRGRAAQVRGRDDDAEGAAKFVGEFAQPPLEAVRRCPSRGCPEIAGAEVDCGAVEPAALAVPPARTRAATANAAQDAAPETSPQCDSDGPGERFTHDLQGDHSLLPVRAPTGRPTPRTSGPKPDHVPAREAEPCDQDHEPICFSPPCDLDHKLLSARAARLRGRFGSYGSREATWRSVPGLASGRGFPLAAVGTLKITRRGLSGSLATGSKNA